MNLSDFDTPFPLLTPKRAAILRAGDDKPRTPHEAEYLGLFRDGPAVRRNGKATLRLLSALEAGQDSFVRWLEINANPPAETLAEIDRIRAAWLAERPAGESRDATADAWSASAESRQCQALIDGARSNIIPLRAAA